jgi:hypothetical protein
MKMLLLIISITTTAAAAAATICNWVGSVSVDNLTSPVLVWNWARVCFTIPTLAA